MKRETRGAEDPGVCEARARRFWSPAAVEVRQHLQSVGCDVSGPDKLLRLAEAEHAASASVNMGQLALRSQMAEAATVLEAVRAEVEALRKALRELQGIHPKPDGLAEIIVEVELLTRDAERRLVAAERKHSTLKAAFRDGADKLQASSGAGQQAIVDSVMALVAVCRTRATAMGGEDAAVFAADPVLVELAHLAPDSLIDHDQEIELYEQVAEEARRPGMVRAVYVKALGPYAEAVAQKVGTGRSLPRESGMRSPEPSPDPMMREVF